MLNPCHSISFGVLRILYKIQSDLQFDFVLRSKIWTQLTMKHSKNYVKCEIVQMTVFFACNIKHVNLSNFGRLLETKSVGVSFSGDIEMLFLGQFKILYSKRVLPLSFFVFCFFFSKGILGWFALSLGVWIRAMLNAFHLSQDFLVCPMSWWHQDVRPTPSPPQNTNSLNQWWTATPLMFKTNQAEF